MKNRTFRYGVSASLCLLQVIFATPLGAKASSFSDAKALDEIFAAAIKAVGGEKELGKIRSIEALADCTGPKGTYSTEVASYRFGKTIFKQKFSYGDPANIFINDAIIWAESDKTGDFSIPSSMEKLVVHLHEFQLMAFDFQKLFHDFAIEGTENFENRPSIKVRAKTELESAIYLYFDVETKLLAGYILPIPNSDLSVKNVFNEWKTVGKIKLPSVVTATDPSGVWVLRFNTITLNKTSVKAFDVPPLVTDLKELLRLHEQQKTAHLTYNAELFADMFNEELTQLQKGVVSTRTKAENLARFRSYFAQFKFLEWEDVKPPVVRISKDGTMATMIVQKRVRGVSKDANGRDKPEHTEFAWLEVWEKIKGQWKLMTIASTEKAIQE